VVEKKSSEKKRTEKKQAAIVLNFSLIIFLND